MIEEQINRIERVKYLLAQKLNGAIGPGEQTELDAWLIEDTSHQELLNELRKESNWKERNDLIENLNLEELWEQFCASTNYNKIKLKRRLFTVAKYAAILLPFIIGVSIILNKRFVNNDICIVETKQAISPGSKGARLILSDGQSIDIDENVKTIVEKDGTTITTDSVQIQYVGKKQTKDNHAEKTLYNTIEVARGQEYNMMLADGTKVWINSMSSIKYPVQFSENIREVEITGEVYFEVEHDFSKPFIVRTPVYNVEVLGTSFNVSCYSNDKEVHTTLVEGSVLIDNIPGEKESFKLKPNQQFLYSRSEASKSVKYVNAGRFTAWTKGYFYFEDQTLEQIFMKLERWYDINVIYQNKNAKEELFTGSLPRFKDAETIFKLITKVSDVEIITKGNEVMIK